MALRDLRPATELELLCDDGVPLENAAHGVNAWSSLVLPLRDYFKRIGFRAFVSSNSAIFYPGEKNPLGPDVYVVNGGEDRGQGYWYVEAEGNLYPTLIIEMLSQSTEEHDRGYKMRIYQDVFRTPDYFLFESSTGGVECYQLKRGVYRRSHSDRRGHFRCLSLELSVGVVNWQLRWFDKRGKLLPEYQELRERADRAELCAAVERERADRAELNVAVERDRADQQRQQAEYEHQRAEHERSRAERLAARLRELGIDEETV